MVFLVLLSLQSALQAVWSNPVTLSTSNAAANEVSVNASGDAVSVWQRTDGSTFRIEGSFLPFVGSWTMPSTLSVVGQNAFVPQVAIDPSDHSVAVWIRFDGSNYVVQSSTSAFGGAWSSPINVSASGSNADMPQVAVDPSGNAVAIWTKIIGGFAVVQGATLGFGNSSWSSPVNLSALGQNAQDTSIGVDAAGNAVALWARFDGSNYIVQSATLPFGGSWTSPVDISAPGQDAITCHVAVDPSGNAISVWARFSGVNSIVQSATLPFGGSWTSPVDLSAAGGDAQDPHLAVDPNGNAVAVWSRNNGSNTIVQATYLPFGGSWGVPVDLSATGQNAFQAYVALDAAGNATATWSRNSIIQVSMLPVGWNWTLPVDISTVSELSEGPRIGISANGYAVITWRNDTRQVIQAATWTPPCTLCPSCPDFCEMCLAADCPNRCDGCPVACSDPCQPCPSCPACPACPACTCTCDPHVSVRPTISCGSSSLYSHKHRFNKPIKVKQSKKKKKK